MKSTMRSGLLGLLLAGSSLVALPAPAHAIPVFDSANYAQNLLTAARTLQQIEQQMRSLQNEAAMLSNMERNLARIDFPQLEQLRQRLDRINGLMNQAQGVDFRVDRLEQQLRRLYPEDFEQLVGRDERAANARARLDAAMASYRQTMGVQSRIVANVQEDARALQEIVARSQGAAGALQASQATNQLLALTAQQQMQIQAMLAAQFRSEALDAARRAQIEREAREEVRRFLGDGRAYTPRR